MCKQSTLTGGSEASIPLPPRLANCFYQCTPVSDAMQRRTVLKGLGGIAGATTIGVIANESTQSARPQGSVDGLSIPDKEKTVNNAVSGLRITVSGSYEWTTEATITRAVLRLDGRQPNQDWMQLTATELQTTESSGEYDVEGNLLDIRGVEASDVNPVNRGESKETTVEIRLTLSLYSDGRQLTTKEIQDSATVTVTREQVSVEATITGEGEIAVLT